MVEGNGCCAKKGPGYASPMEAMNGPRETLIYVTCVYNGIFLLSILNLMHSLSLFFFSFPFFSPF
jgi:56kDa selenium binding protein (SBP56)